MHEYRLTHVSDAALLHDLAHLVKQDHATTARLIAHLAEVDARRLFAPAGHPSMFAYCVEELHFSEDSAYKRIRAARAARQFPALFTALADGRLHLAAVALLAPHLTAENASELIEAATHRSKTEVDQWLARRFAASGPERAPAVIIRPVTQLAPGRVVSAIGDLLAATVSAADNAPSAKLDPCGAQTDTSDAGRSEQADSNSPGLAAQSELSSSPNGTKTLSDEDQLAPGRVESVEVARSLEERYSVHLTIPKSIHDKLRRAQSLLSHAIPSGDVVQILDRALDTLIAQLERRKLGSASPRARASASDSSTSSGRASSTRYIPARVRRAVWERDQGQCTFVTHAGHRCSARRLLEFDHIQPVARGGKATVEGLRLRCRTHNQYSAERAFGAEFMQQKRKLPRRAQNQPDRVREPSGLWRITRKPWWTRSDRLASAGPQTSQATRFDVPPERVTQLAPGRVQSRACGGDAAGRRAHGAQ